MQQKQDIKGFTILELLVVITIVAIVSAVGYPNFMEWSEDRKVRKASEQIASMLTNINTQLQRGNFQYVQFQIIPGGTSSTTIRTKLAGFVFLTSTYPITISCCSDLVLVASLTHFGTPLFHQGRADS